jgi:hypothetical protein
MAVLAMFQNGGIITEESFKKAVPPEKTEIIKLFLKNNSRRCEELREQGWLPTNPYEFNPLLTYPIIQLNDREYMCPFLPFLLDRSTRGIYYILFDKFKESFTRTFGVIFEKYVGMILNPFFPHEHIFCERSYKKKENLVKTVDWGIKEGHWLSLLECKTKRLRQKETKATGDLRQLDQDLESGVVDGLVALNRQIKDMKDLNEEFPEYKDIFHVIPIVVLIDRLYFSSSPLIKRRINKILMDKFGIEMQDYEVIDIEELENMLPLAKVIGKRKTLRSLVENKQADGNFRHDSFWNYMAKKYPSELKVHPRLKIKFDSIVDEAKRYFFGNPKNN